MIIKKIIFTTVAFLTLAQLSLAQTTFDKKKLDHYFDTLEQNNKFIGSVSVSKDGEIIYSKSVGFADVESKIKATDKTKYRIGSISKSFTAVLVLKAVENNKLDLSTTINKWFPTISNGDKITVKQLLNHRSGIHNFTDDSDYLDWNTQSKTEKEMIEIISKGGSDFTPDSKAEYSNSNYVLLTYI
ncbi:MAG: serine hydrolase domain-containing protein, partial [Flavobacterium sp.]|uniref:serine hydrolase domain-containing protein n=1 Tax=Flavobacterium sp. TaxID=239 RepID=UPI002FCB8FBA